MKPSDLKALLEKASPRPWDGMNDTWKDAFSPDPQALVNRAITEAVMNRADLLIELWGAAIKLAEDEDCWVGFYEALGKLEKS